MSNEHAAPAASPAPDHTRRGGRGPESPPDRIETPSGSRYAYPGRPGDVWQDDDGNWFVLFPDGMLRMIEADAEPIDPYDRSLIDGPALLPVIIENTHV